MNWNRNILPVLILCIAFYNGMCQDYQHNILTDQLDYFERNSYSEKVILDINKDLYFAGEEIRFSITIIEGKYNYAEALSTNVSVEILDATLQPIIRKKFNVDGARGAGIIQLPSDISTGNYMIRSYTSWMRNDKPDYYFHQELSIINPAKPPTTLINKQSENVRISFHPEGGTLLPNIENNIVVRITDRYHRPLRTPCYIINSDLDTCATVTCNEMGIGDFKLLPRDNMEYGIAYKDSLYRLPSCDEQGAALQISYDEDIYEIQVSTGSGRPADELLKLFIHHRGDLQFFSTIEQTSNFSLHNISSSRLSFGINEVVILDNNYNYLASRLIHKTDERNIYFELIGDSLKFSRRESGNISFKTVPHSIVSASIYKPTKSEFHSSTLSNIIEIEGEIGPYYSSDTDINLSLIYAGEGKYSYRNLLNVHSFDYPPEITGQLISGSLFNESLKNSSDFNLYVAMLGKNSNIEKVEVRENGTFFISPGEQTKQGRIIFLSDSMQKLNIIINPEFSNVFSDIALPEFDIKELPVIEIEKQMVESQLRSIYKSKNEDSQDSAIVKFYGPPDESINLRDYINLPIMEEFFRELLQSSIFTRKNGSLKLNVLSKYTNRIIGPNPMYLVDGIPVFNTSTILDLDPEAINKIHIKANRYIYGNLVMDGIVDIESNAGDASVLQLGDNVASYVFTPASSISSLDIPTVNHAVSKQHHPDLRDVICWQPMLSTDQDGIGEIKFTTSDIAGEFILKVTVLTRDGIIRTFYETLIVN